MIKNNLLDRFLAWLDRTSDTHGMAKALEKWKAEIK